MGKRWILVIFLTVLIVGFLFFDPAVRVVEAQQQHSTSFSDDFSVDTGSWQYLGTAYRDPANKYLVLTNPGYGQGGVAFFNAPINGPFTASFRYKADGGYQGDGFTMFFYKQHYSSIGGGGSLAFTTKNNEIVPGYGIEFDGWQNIPADFQQFAGMQQNPQGDPSPSHIALIKDYVGNHLTYVNDRRVAGNEWHQVTIEVQLSSVKVFVDQDLVLQWSGTLDRTFDRFGFSGATGSGGSNRHLIDDFSITAQSLKTPVLTTYCVTSVSQSSFNVKINGYLSFDGTPIADLPIMLSYSVTGGESWQELTLVHTSSDGGYSALWLPSVTGDYMLKATFRGNKDYLGTVNIVNFAMEPYSEQSVFSVTSNSIVSKLYFNSDTKELSFSVLGNSGTRGYVNVFIPNSLVTDISGLRVYIDEKQIEYTKQPKNDGWLLSFSYDHSMHTVVISLGASQSTGQSLQSPELQLDWVNTAILIVMAALVAIAGISAFAFLKKQKSQSTC